MPDSAVLTKEEIRIVDEFRRNPFAEFTIREIAKKLNKKSYAWVFKAVGKLETLGILNTRHAGKSRLCSINLDSQISVTYLSFLDELDAYEKQLPRRNISELLASIRTPCFTFMVTGSYASGKATDKSDLDIIVLVGSGANRQEIQAKLRSAGELMIPRPHIYVFTYREFEEMLLLRNENYGKEAFRNRIIISGAQNYYIMMRRAIRNGFRG